MSETKVKRFAVDTWAKGTRGITRAHATDKAKLVNLALWDDGLLGPRPLWPDFTVLPSAISSTAKFWQANFSTDATNVTTDRGFCVADSAGVHFFRYGDTTAYATLVTTLRHMRPSASVSQWDDTTYIVGRHYFLMRDSSLAYNITNVDITTALGTAFSTTFSVNAECRSAVHQGRAFYAIPAEISGVGTPWRRFNRVYYSNDQAPSTFTNDGAPENAGFFDVDGDIKGMVSIGSNLLIWCSNGNWFMLSGRGNPSEGTLNFLGRNRIPGDGRYPRLLDKTAYFLSSDGMGVVTINEGGQFDDQALSHLSLGLGSYLYSETPPSQLEISSLANSIIMPHFETFNHRRYYAGVWVEEDWGFTTEGNHQVAVDEHNNRELLFAYLSGAPNRWKVTYRSIDNQIPTSSESGYPGSFEETEAAALSLPRILEPTQMVRVKRIIIDCQTFKDPGTPALTLAVTDGYGVSKGFTLGPTSHLLSSVSTGNNLPLRIVATPTTSPMPYTPYCDVELSGIIGVAFESITVEYEISTGGIL